MTTQEKKQRSWWRNFFLERGFHIRQMRRLLILTLIVIALSTLMLGIFYNLLMDQLTSGDLPAYFMPEEMEQLAAKIPGLQKTLMTWVLIMGGTNVVITLFISIFITNKLGGPLFHFKRAVKKIGEGNLSTDIQLRDGDEFQDLAETLDAAVARIQLMIMAVNENIDVLENAVNKQEVNPDVEQAIKGCRSALSYFETVQIPDSY